jgi:hypothetical protein
MHTTNYINYEGVYVVGGVHVRVFWQYKNNKKVVSFWR